MDTSPDRKKHLLICGDVKGQIDELSARVIAIQEKAPISAMLCVGKFFGPTIESLNPYLAGEKSLPVLTYFIATQDEAHLLDPDTRKGGEVCKNLINLGRVGVSEVQGLSVGYVSLTSSGNADQQAEINRYIARFTENRFKGLDILITNDWPRGTLKGLTGDQLPQTGISLFDFDTIGQDFIADIASASIPRYHFATTPNKQFFYQRPPYKNGPQFGNERNAHVTRFFSLASAFNPQKRQFLYALKIEPLLGMPPNDLYAPVENTTEFPYKHHVEGPPQKKPKVDRAAASFVEDLRPAYAMPKQRNQRNDINAGARSSQCWFCMENEVFEEHLVVSLGTHFYLTLAKGGLTDTHVLLCPIKHSPCLSLLDTAAFNEFLKWKAALTQFFAKHGQIAVTFEHNSPGKFPHLQHCHIQIIGLPETYKRRVREFFEYEAKASQLEYVEVKLNEEESNIQRQILSVSGQSPSFWLQLPDVNVVGVIENRFPASFGRRFIAAALEHPQLENWKNCVQTRAQEEAMKLQFRTDFEPFAPKF